MHYIHTNTHTHTHTHTNVGVGIAEIWGAAPPQDVVAKYDANKDLKWSPKEFQAFMQATSANYTFAEVHKTKKKKDKCQFYLCAGAQD